MDRQEMMRAFQAARSDTAGTPGLRGVVNALEIVADLLLDIRDRLREGG
jgi:hypothetical protein